MTAAFDKLSRPVQKWVRSREWRELRSIQAEAIHVINDGNSDLIISAKTAGGKTEAAFLPLISRVLEEPAQKNGFDLLYIGPLKALITDQSERLDDICADLGLPVYPWHGDISASIKNRALKNPAGLLLITPESLEALFIRRGLEIGRLFGATRAVVIDELHGMLDSERGIQVRSLLTRLECVLNRKIRRIGLSATLGDMKMASAYLGPNNPDSVKWIEEKGQGELLLELRGYSTGSADENIPCATEAVSRHIFKNLRGSNNLVFAGSRNSVEVYSDLLRNICEHENLPQEFYAHHANISRNHRNFVEKRLKDKKKPPTTAICTSTLELGIDIGDVKCVAQLGAPFTVASLRQRLGRSGRREEVPAILRQYAIEAKLSDNDNFSDRLRLGLIRSIAMIELLLEKWTEPPRSEALHLSTLVHQILSFIAERGGAFAGQIHHVLCRQGPFRKVDSETFLDVLKAIGNPKTKLIEQSSNGLLLLGSTGEKLVEHHSFYAVFHTPEEFRLVSDGAELGTLPMQNVLAPGMMLIFSGQRWIVVGILYAEKVIQVKPAAAGVPPAFGGEPGHIHDRVIEKMFSIYQSENQYIYMNKDAVDLLSEARSNFRLMGLNSTSLVQVGEKSHILATRSGTIKTATLALALGAMGFQVLQLDGFLSVEAGKSDRPLKDALEEIASGRKVDLFRHSPNLIFEKFHIHLTPELLEKDALSSRLSLDDLQNICRNLLS